MKPLHAQISDYVMTNIKNGEWPVGHLLPTEMELCEQFGVSRASVRTALLGLVNDGYLIHGVYRELCRGHAPAGRGD